MIQNDSLFLADLRGSNFFNHDSTELLTAPRSVDNGGRFTFLDEKKREEYCRPPPMAFCRRFFRKVHRLEPTGGPSSFRPTFTMGSGSALSLRGSQDPPAFVSPRSSPSWNTESETLMWDDKDYALSSTPGVNALLLVLAAILKDEKKILSEFDKYMSVLKNMDFSKDTVKTFPRGCEAYGKLAEMIIDRINSKLNKNYIIKSVK